MLLMSAHEMLTLGASVTGTVDGDTYDPDNLCDGDPHNPVRTPDGTVSFTVTALAALSGINGIALINTDLDAAIVATFSGLGTVTTLAVPENRIRRNPYEIISPSGSVSSFTLSATAGRAATIGEAVAGIFRPVRTLPPGPTFQRLGFGIPHPGEFGGMGYSKGGESLLFGGRVILQDSAKEVVDAAWRASQENSKPTLIVLREDTFDEVHAVTWDTYEPQPLVLDHWGVNVVWREIARLRWPA